MLAMFFTAASFVPLSFLVLDNTNTSIALWSLVVTTVGGLIARWFDQRKLDKQRAWDLADRQELKTQLADHTDKADSTRVHIVKAIEENTEITKSAVVEAQKAYTEANHVNLKIAAATDAPLEEIKNLQEYVRVKMHAINNKLMAQLVTGEPVVTRDGSAK